MSLYPIIWAAEHAPVRDAEERAILVALVMKGDFDGCNCFRSYGTLAKVARVDKKTAGRRCREMESRGILRRQTGNLPPRWLAIPEDQRPIVWEVMIPASFYSAAQLDEVNEQRANLGRPNITPQTRPNLPEAPPKTSRSDKGTKRPKKNPEVSAPSTPGTISPHPGDYQSPGTPGTISPHPQDSQSPPQGLEVPLPSESPSESPSLSRDTADEAKVEKDERETSAPREDDETARVAEQFVADLPGRLGRATVRRLAPLVDAAFADGYTTETLRAELAERVDVSRIESRGAVPGLYARALEDLPAAPAPRSNVADIDVRRRRPKVPDEYAL